MNERIKLLAEQAGISGYFAAGTKLATPIPLSPEMQKFAELLVEDTINIMKQEWYDHNNAPKVEGETPRDVGMRVGAKSQTIRLMHMVQKHFGVEK